MSKKSFKMIRFFLMIVVVLAFIQCSPSGPTQDKPYNILFILVDDLGYNDVGFMGSSYYETPNIDQLASRGTYFTQAYSGSRVCSPSRATIMTGQYTARTGITDWIGAPEGESWRQLNRHDKLLPAEYNHHLAHELLVLPEALKNAGYKTFFAGKWHLGGEGSYPEDHGFDINVGGYESGSPRGGYFSPFNNPKLEDVEKGKNLTMLLAEKTSEFISENRDTSFFAFLSFYAVHGPIQTTKGKWRKYRNKAVKAGLEEPGYRMERVLPYRLHQDNPVYGGLVESMDDAVGHVLTTLEETNLLDHTIVIFTSDNGGVVSGDNYSTNLSPLRGGKGYQWEGGIRVPLIIYHPDMQEGQKQKSETPVTGADLYPTLMDMIKETTPADQPFDGITILPLLQGDSIAERSLYWHYPHYGNQGGEPSSMIRRGQWKLIHYYENGRNELYSMKDGLTETENLADKNKVEAEVLWAELQNYLNAVDANFPRPDPEYDPEERGKWERQVEEQRMPALEKLRKERLSEDYLPNEDWWGSEKNM